MDPWIHGFMDPWIHIFELWSRIICYCVTQDQFPATFSGTQLNMIYTTAPESLRAKCTTIDQEKKITRTKHLERTLETPGEMSSFLKKKNVFWNISFLHAARFARGRGFCKFCTERVRPTKSYTNLQKMQEKRPFARHFCRPFCYCVFC